MRAAEPGEQLGRKDLRPFGKTAADGRGLAFPGEADARILAEAFDPENVVAAENRFFPTAERDGERRFRLLAPFHGGRRLTLLAGRGEQLRHPDRPQQAPHGHPQPDPVDRLEEVVDRPNLERGDGILRMGGDEADVRPIGEFAQELEPRSPRQLDIEKEDVGGMLLEHPAGLRDIPHGGEDLDLVVRREQLAESEARRGLVIDEECRGHRGNLSGRSDQEDLRGRPSDKERADRRRDRGRRCPPGCGTAKPVPQVFHTPGRLPVRRRGLPGTAGCGRIGEVYRLHRSTGGCRVCPPLPALPRRSTLEP